MIINMGIIYKILFPSGKSYIGQTKQTLKRRLQSHTRAKRNTAICCAFKKYGVNFEAIVLETVNDDLLNEREVYYIEYYKTLSPNGYNLSTGGNNQTTYSRETREKNSKNSRKYTDNTLPMYVVRVLTSERTGYSVQHPNLQRKEFSSKRFTDEQKKRMAIEYLESGRIPERWNRLPKYISEIRRKGVLIGYRVIHPKLPYKSFASALKDLEYNKTCALNYMIQQKLPEKENGLPMYVYRTNKSGYDTYIVKLPNKPAKVFSSKKISNEEKMELAINYLNITQ